MSVAIGTLLNLTWVVDCHGFHGHLPGSPATPALIGGEHHLQRSERGYVLRGPDYHTTTLTTTYRQQHTRGTGGGCERRGVQEGVRYRWGVRGEGYRWGCDRRGVQEGVRYRWGVRE